MGDRTPATNWLLVTLLAAVFMTTADNSIVNVAIPSIDSGVGAGGGELELVVSAYLIRHGRPALHRRHSRYRGREPHRRGWPS